MSALQHRLSQFLELELHHSLGAYRRASDQLRVLERQLAEDQLLPEEQHSEFLQKLTGLMRVYNHELDLCHDASLDVGRHPAPPATALPQTGVSAEEPTGGADVTAFSWITGFYEAAVHTLRAESRNDPECRGLLDFERALLEKRADPPAANEEHRERRRARYEGRLADALAVGLPHEGGGEQPGRPPGAHEDTVTTIVESHLAANHKQPLASFIVCALVDAHLQMHTAESRLTAPLGVRLEMASRDREEIEAILRRSIVINTFVWAASRVAPWAFAENTSERGYIVNYYDRAWRNNMPMRAMWISAQVSLLALHRRAYARGLLGEKAGAYRDYHKLQRHIRETSRRIERAPLRVEGSREFLEGLDALADYHIGELYRSDRDHVSALTHFHRAYDRLRRLRQESQHLVITNSRWFVQLEMSLGKSSYELGQHKASLAWYLRTWRSLLDLLAVDTAGEVNPDALGNALEWLERIVDEPELHKRDVISYLRPVVDQLLAFRVDPRFTALASDVILRLGHLLFVLYLSEGPHGLVTPEDETALRERGEPQRSLALDCVRRAWQLDRSHTLAMSDLLKIHFRSIRDYGTARAELERAIEDPRRVADSWTDASEGVESLSRAIEYVLLQQLRLSPAGEEPDQTIARGLLHSLLTHTDSIETRKTHVFDYLTRVPTSTRLPDREYDPAIEFVCLRRYKLGVPDPPAAPIVPLARRRLLRSHPSEPERRTCPRRRDRPRHLICRVPLSRRVRAGRHRRDRRHPRPRRPRILARAAARTTPRDAPAGRSPT